jgi:putative oxidoreductase
MLERIAILGRSGTRALDFAAPAVDLLLRLWVANVFFKSGLTKIANFDSTISLFENEYAVPFLPPELAAYLGTGAELVLPIFLALGLGTRLAAMALFVFNIVAVISYPDLSPAGRNEHIYWGILMLVTIVHGGGKLALDHWIGRSLPGNEPRRQAQWAR